MNTPSEGIHISHHVYDELTLLAPESKTLEAAQLLRDAFYHGFPYLLSRGTRQRFGRNRDRSDLGSGRFG